MEVERLIRQLMNDTAINEQSKEITPNSTFLKLTSVNSGNDLTVQYNDKGIICVYFRNSQFYDEPDDVLVEIIKAIAQGDVGLRENKDGLVYYVAQLDNGTIIEPTRHTESY